MIISLEWALRGETGVLACPESCCTVLVVEWTVQYSFTVFRAEEKNKIELRQEPVGLYGHSMNDH